MRGLIRLAAALVPLACGVPAPPPVDGTRDIHRTAGTGGSFGAGSLELHVGLGPAVRVKHVRVLWPDSARASQTWTDLAPLRAYHLVQGQPARLMDRPAVPLRRTAVARHDH